MLNCSRPLTCISCHKPGNSTFPLQMTAELPLLDCANPISVSPALLENTCWLCERSTCPQVYQMTLLPITSFLWHTWRFTKHRSCSCHRLVPTTYLLGSGDNFAVNVVQCVFHFALCLLCFLCAKTKLSVSSQIQVPFPFENYVNFNFLVSNLCYPFH